MNASANYIISNKKLKADSLHVNIKLRKITGNLRVLKFRDKDTRQIVLFVPALDLTSYGATDKKATQMLKFSIEQYFEFLLNLSHKKIQQELSALGWNHKSITPKDFSKAYIDIDGDLKNFNAVGDTVEILTVEA
jgi:hypothetical protein